MASSQLGRLVPGMPARRGLGGMLTSVETVVCSVSITPWKRRPFRLSRECPVIRTALDEIRNQPPHDKQLLLWLEPGRPDPGGRQYQWMHRILYEEGWQAYFDHTLRSIVWPSEFDRSTFGIVLRQPGPCPQGRIPWRCYSMWSDVLKKTAGAFLQLPAPWIAYVGAPKRLSSDPSFSLHEVRQELGPLVVLGCREFVLDGKPDADVLAIYAQFACGFPNLKIRLGVEPFDVNANDYSWREFTRGFEMWSLGAMMEDRSRVHCALRRSEAGDIPSIAPDEFAKFVPIMVKTKVVTPQDDDAPEYFDVTEEYYISALEPLVGCGIRRIAVPALYWTPMVIDWLLDMMMTDDSEASTAIEL